MVRRRNLAGTEGSGCLETSAGTEVASTVTNLVCSFSSLDAQSVDHGSESLRISRIGMKH